MYCIAFAVQEKIDLLTERLEAVGGDKVEAGDSADGTSISKHVFKKRK